MYTCIYIYIVMYLYIYIYIYVLDFIDVPERHQGSVSAAHCTKLALRMAVLFWLSATLVVRNNIGCAQSCLCAIYAGLRRLRAEAPALIK